MSLNPSTSYPGQIDTTAPADYPYGKAQNESVAGASDGTPLEKAWVNDLWGFLQAVLAAAGITPSGTPDKVGASQYLQGLQLIFAKAFAAYNIGGTDVDDAALFTLTVNQVSGSFSLASNEVQVPAAGNYEVHVGIPLQVTGGTAPYEVSVELMKGGSVVGASALSTSVAQAGGAAIISRTFIVAVATPASEKFSVRSNANNQLVAGSGTLLIRRLD
jgi:hypothetical protein